MTAKKKEDDLTENIRTLRNEIRRKVEDELSIEYAEAQKEGKYPWEGLWLTPQDIERLHKKLQRNDRIVLMEVCFLLFLMSLSSYVLYWFLKWYFLPR